MQWWDRTINIFFSYHIRIIILLISLISQLENQGQTEWIGDGFCDDINNNEVCDFDNGDCCGAKVKKQFCLNCTCISKYISSYWYQISSI